MSAWYCIRTATRQEFKVIDGLKDLAQEHSIELDAYLPCETRWNRLARVKTAKQAPILPGYLFVSVEPDHLWRIDRLEGVYQILGWATRQTAKEAARLSAFVNELRGAQDAGEFDRTKPHKRDRRHKLKPGQSVRVREGGFGGIIGQIIELKGADRIRVLMTLFGREVPVELYAKEVDPQDSVAPKAA